MADYTSQPTLQSQRRPIGAGPDDEVELQNGLIIRDMRTNERFWMHDAIIDEYGPILGADTFAIYASLCLMANRSQYCWPSLSRLARHWGKGKTTVSRAVTLLQDLRLIHIKRTERDDGGTSNNIYYLLEPAPLDEALAGLLSALLHRGASPDDAVERVLTLLPESWQPLRRKKGGPATRADWESLLRSLLPRSCNGMADTAPGPGGSYSGMGHPVEERDDLERDGDGPADERGGPATDRGYIPRGPGAVSPQDHKEIKSNEEQNKESQKGHQQQGAGGGGILHTDDEIRQYQLADDEVLLDAGEEGAQPVHLYDLVRHDILATLENWGLRHSTDCYYSIEQFLGLGSDEWTAEEERKRSYHGALRREMEGLYREIGALSIDEALGRYFTADVVERFRPTTAEEEQRVREWLRYVHGDAGRGLDNPAGFLRSRLEAGQWPPRGARARKPGPA